MNYQRNDRYIKAFGENLKEIRQGKKLSQEDLAFKAGLTLSQVGRIERGKINTSISTIYTIAKALEIESFELFRFNF